MPSFAGARTAVSRGRDAEKHTDLAGNPDPVVEESPHELLLKKLAASKAERHVKPQPKVTSREHREQHA